MTDTISIDLAAWLAAQPDLARIEMFLADINGAAKGKWLTPEKALGVARKGLAMPVSVFAQDAFGRDVPAAGLAFGTGDPDGLAFPVTGRFAPMPWLDDASAQVLITLRDKSGAPCAADPRGVLENVLARYAAKGLKPVVATEQEFYLYRPQDGRPTPPDGQMLRNDTLSTAALAAHRALFDEMFAAFAAQGIPADGLTSEAGPGQYEINLLHRADALAAADDVVLLKRTVKALARKHGLAATFMAKPYGEASGNGMHIHASLLDSQGVNVLAQDDGAPGAVLRHAVAGLLAAMPGSMLAFAPHANSYRRLRPDAHAPISAGWGYDDRSAALRVITGDAKATRIEHRISGADCNPYLAMAAMLGAMLEGIEAAVEPPAPQDPKDPEAGVPLPTEWGAAMSAFARCPHVAAIFGPAFRDIYLACKRQDRDQFLADVTALEYAAYLELA
jgi:glutamine synthetase